MQYDGQLYLDFKVQYARATYIDRRTKKRIGQDELKQWLPKRRTTRQQLDNEVILRDYRLDHIGELRINGELWTVRPICDLLHSYRVALAEASAEPISPDEAVD